MADKSILFNTQVHLSNIDRHQYQNMRFKISLNPFESVRHMLLRIIAKSIFPHIPLSFTKRGANNSRPDLQSKNVSGDYEFWIDVGKPDHKRIKRASNLSEHVIIIAENDDKWCADNFNQIMLLDNINIIMIDPKFVASLANELTRSIKWSVVLEGDKISISNDSHFITSNICDYHSINEPPLLH